MDGVVPFDFFLENAGAPATPDRSGSVSKDLRLLACIVSDGLSLPGSAAHGQLTVRYCVQMIFPNPVSGFQKKFLKKSRGFCRIFIAGVKSAHG